MPRFHPSCSRECYVTSPGPTPEKRRWEDQCSEKPLKKGFSCRTRDCGCQEHPLHPEVCSLSISSHIKYPTFHHTPHCILAKPIPCAKCADCGEGGDLGSHTWFAFSTAKSSRAIFSSTKLASEQPSKKWL